jgi:hypothetical protein
MRPIVGAVEAVERWLFVVVKSLALVMQAFVEFVLVAT